MRGRQGGFTFVELLVASTMMAVLFVGLTGHLQAGARIWQRVTSAGESLQQERVALSRLERDLANAVLYQPDGIYGAEKGQMPEPAFETDALRFITAEPSARADRPPALRSVTYRCEKLDGGPALWRSGQSIADARDHRAPTTIGLLPGCSRLSIHYAYLGQTPGRLEWDSTWQESHTQLPRLLTIVVGAPGRTLTREFLIPSGVLHARTEDPGPPS